jgi:hypothetical protein
MHNNTHTKKTFMKEDLSDFLEYIVRRTCYMILYKYQCSNVLYSPVVYKSEGWLLQFENYSEYSIFFS